MGHRALVAYKRDNEQYDTYYTHWGANGLKLTHEIGSDTPFGDGYVDRDEGPVAEDTSLYHVVTEELDYLHHEAFYVVDREFDVAPLRTYCPALFDVFGHGVNQTETVGVGFLDSVRWFAGDPVGDGSNRGEFRGIKDVVSDQFDELFDDYREAHRYMFDQFGGRFDSPGPVWPAERSGNLGQLVREAREESPSPGDEQYRYDR